LALPGRIESLEAEQQRLQDAVASPDFYKEGSDAIARTLARLDAIEQELLDAMTRWDQLDSLTKR
jgi:ATP-binding cassette subfamily F protein uup